MFDQVSRGMASAAGKTYLATHDESGPRSYWANAALSPSSLSVLRAVQAYLRMLDPAFVSFPLEQLFMLSHDIDVGSIRSLAERPSIRQDVGLAFFNCCAFTDHLPFNLRRPCQPEEGVLLWAQGGRDPPCLGISSLPAGPTIHDVQYFQL